MAKIVSISKHRVFPLNSRNEYSFKNGNSSLTFQISEDNMSLVDSSSIRLNFLLNLIDDATTRNGQTPVRPNNQDTAGTGTKACNLNARIGASAVIGVMRLSNMNSEVIEEVRSYGHLLASVLPATHSFETYQNWGSCKYNAFANELTQGVAVNGVIPCSVQLRAGLLNTGRPISTADLGGLQITIQLNSDSQVLNADSSTYHYELSNVSLTYTGLNLASADMPSSEMLQYPAYSSYVNIIQSSDSSQSLALGLRSTRALFSNYIKTANLNNFAEDGYETNRLQSGAGDTAIKTMTHMRNNIKFPKKYDINERIPVTNNVYEAQLQREYLDCFHGAFRYIDSCLQSPETQGFKSVDLAEENHPTIKFVGGTGANYDGLKTGMGADFQNAMYSARIQSELLDGTPNTAFTYALSNQGLAVKRQNVQPVM